MKTNILSICVSILLSLCLVSTAISNEKKDEPQLTIIEKPHKIKNLYHIINGIKNNLTKFKNSHHIYDYQLSLDNKFAFVYHMDFPPTRLSIYDLSKNTMTGQVNAIGGGKLFWASANRIIGISGCGTGCRFLAIYNTAGEMIYSGPSKGEHGWVTQNPTNEYIIDISQEEEWADFIKITRISDCQSYVEKKERLYLNTLEYPEWISPNQLSFSYKVSGENEVYKMVLDLSKYMDLFK